MKVSVRTLEQYIPFDLPPVDELAARINAQLGGVEEIIQLHEKYKDARVVQVVECQKHTNADKLSVCMIDTGADELVQVVCGAPNVQAGMWAVWLPPESVVPSTYNDDEPFVLGARELRGVMSHGMLASARELALGEDHNGIIAITESDLPGGATPTAGASFAELFGLDDTIIDIENKMFTHRPDLFGQLGVARELYAILRPQPVDGSHTEPYIIEEDWYWASAQFSASQGLPLEVFNDVTDAAPRFMAVAMKDVTVGPSPLWLQCELVRWGAKPVNNVVDITNYIMLLTAQPTHAYDYDTLRGHKLGVRMASADETVELLNGKTYQLTTDDIVIADAEGVVGLAGVMGGHATQVSNDTKNIVLEVANFDMYAVRRSSMRHGLFTDAVTRFNKGQSKLQNDRVTARLLSLLHELTGAEQASDVFDLRDEMIEMNSSTLHGAQVVPASFINERLGLNLTAVEISNLLRGANFAAFSSDESGVALNVTAPFWRTDIAIPEDIVEEVGRLYGYDRLPRVLPQRSVAPTQKNQQRELAELVRQTLARAGANEVLTYSFVHERVLAAAGQDPEDAYQIANALSPDLQYYRLSLTPSLLDKVHANSKAGYDEFALFEIGKSHSRKAGLDEDGLPVEPGRMALVYAAKVARQGAPYYRAKRLLDYLGSQLGLVLEYKRLPESSQLTVATPFAGPRRARVVDQVSGQVIGIIGEYAPAVRKGFKLPEYSAGFELLTEGLLLARKNQTAGYQVLSRYPSVERDICFEVAADVTYGSLVAVVREYLKDVAMDYEVAPVDIYQEDETRKRITIRVTLTPREATLTSDEAGSVIAQVTETVIGQIGATII